ncbi:pentapeptide repeat-containing protein [Pleomorphomonas sp. JP5]|uniref:pentapeptide repeat-containing protein n=1 Tax=Pleomorphomonas sp. JP5 TaxID=2942998 RepID=UPI002043B037|nr:hypothetical protein [Pleomorphomonas sp. JP5]MCM5558500.1 hypothetical protein [Pleomorphomonas sp. JP5]
METEKPQFEVYLDSFRPAKTVTELPPTKETHRIHLDSVDLSRVGDNERPYYSGLRLISSFTENIKIRESDLPNSIFSGLFQRGFDISGSNVGGSYFSDIELNNVEFNCSSLYNSIFIGISKKSSISFSSIKFADFYKSVFRNISIDTDRGLDNVITPESSFVRSNFTSVSLSGFSGHGTDYSATIFDDFEYDEHVFQGAFFVAATFRNGRRIFNYGDESISEFQDSNVSGADFTEFGVMPANMLSGSYYCKELAPPFLPDDFAGELPVERQCGEGQHGILEWGYGDTYNQDGVHIYRDYVLNRNRWTKEQLETCGVSHPGANDSGEILDLTIPVDE